MKLLLVGDPHGKCEDLEDCQKLVEYVAKVARENQVSTVVFLGDQHHFHSVIRAEVLKFWHDAVVRTLSGLDVVMLVGNHDLAGNGDWSCHALIGLSGHCHVVDRPQALIDLESDDLGIWLVPYTPDSEAFKKACQAGKDYPILLCHQTFDGSKYENGFYAGDGIDPNLVPQSTIISGHIHTPQEFGKVWYVGSPRWQTISDANVDRDIWVIDVQDCKVTNKQAFSTNHVCRRILHFVDTPDLPAVIGKLDAKVMVDIIGPAGYIETRKKELLGKGIRIRTFPTDGVRAQVRESEGIAVAFKKFVAEYQPKFGASRADLQRLAKERLGAEA